MPVKPVTKISKRLSDKQLWFIWKTINDLTEIHNNQLEAGASDTGRYSKKGNRAKELIQQQRRFNNKIKSHAKASNKRGCANTGRNLQ